jgi:hypothetical protein
VPESGAGGVVEVDGGGVVVSGFFAAGWQPIVKMDNRAKQSRHFFISLTFHRILTGQYDSRPRRTDIGFP